ncbi:MAG: hypothetical protein ACRD8W_05080 [Nitrososphaeraceae archaeon]
MKGPIEIDCSKVYTSFFRVKRGSDTIEHLTHSNDKFFKYMSNDKSLSCVLRSTIYTGDNVRLYTDENGTVRQEPKNKFIIYPFSEEEEERLLQIKIQRNITDDSFPIIRNTEEEAVEIIEKLLSNE